MEHFAPFYGIEIKLYAKEVIGIHIEFPITLHSVEV